MTTALPPAVDGHRVDFDAPAVNCVATGRDAGERAAVDLAVVDQRVRAQQASLLTDSVPSLRTVPVELMSSVSPSISAPCAASRSAVALLGSEYEKTPLLTSAN
ncbi:hypothetical protein AB4Y64_11075 [Lysobacter sp. TAF61]|uniref:hypothetical protein n=1 Tax=Lysobacter sp. TAF61 TaxID=3233072 RepID=UPI003F94B45C